jgi:hypothetical protein
MTGRPANESNKTSAAEKQQYPDEDGTHEDGRPDDNDTKFFRRIHIITLVKYFKQYFYWLTLAT